MTVAARGVRRRRRGLHEGVVLATRVRVGKGQHPAAGVRGLVAVDAVDRPSACAAGIDAVDAARRLTGLSPGVTRLQGRHRRPWTGQRRGRWRRCVSISHPHLVQRRFVPVIHKAVTFPSISSVHIAAYVPGLL